MVTRSPAVDCRYCRFAHYFSGAGAAFWPLDDVQPGFASERVCNLVFHSTQTLTSHSAFLPKFRICFLLGVPSVADTVDYLPNILLLPDLVHPLVPHVLQGEEAQATHGELIFLG